MRYLIGKERENMTLEDLKGKMLEYRARHNISQTELARRCGLTLMTVNSIENGRQSPSKLTEAKILMVVEKHADIDIESSSV